jgi:methyl-accepting chemotaxis protein
MFRTIKSRIIAWVGGLVLLGLLTLIGLNTWITYQSSKKVMVQYAQSIAQKEAYKIRVLLEEAYNHTESLAKFALAIRREHDSLDRTNIMSQAVKEQLLGQKNSRAYSVLWETNEVALSPPIPKGNHWFFNEDNSTEVLFNTKDLDFQGIYEDTKRTRKPMISNAFYSKNVRALVTLIAYPIIKDNVFLGVAGTHLNINHIQQETLKVHPYNTGFLSIYSNETGMVAGPNTKNPGEIDPTLPEHIRQAIRVGHEAHYQSNDGFDHFFSPITIGETLSPWSVRVSIPSNQIMDETIQNNAETLLLGLLILALILALLTWILRHILMPLKQLNDAMAELSMGHGDLTQQLPINSFDEIGQTADSFNRFIRALRSMMVDVKQHTQGLWKAAQNLNMEVISIQESSTQQAKEADATTNNIENLAHGIGQIALASREAESMARNAHELSSHATDDTHATAQEISHISRSVHELADILRNLESRSLQINGIVGVIKDIADQTNLLALNASIEATRTGGQGKSFSVVADEVRKLAERTTRATREVSEMMNAVQQGIVQSVHNMQLALHQVDEGVKLSKKTSLSIEKIQKNAQHVVKHFEEISLTTAEQSSLSQQISKHIDHIYSMLQRSEIATSHMQQNSEILKSLTDDMERLVHRFKL